MNVAPKLALLFLTCGLSTVQARYVPATVPATQPADFPASKPVEKAGLSVIIQPDGKDTFGVDEPIVLKVSFQNVSKQGIRLPQDPKPRNWQLIATDQATGKTFTGGFFLPGGLDGPLQPLGPLIAPGETFSATVKFVEFHFFKGPMNDADLKQRVFHEQIVALEANHHQATNVRHPLPPGRYDIAVNIRYPYPSRFANGGPSLWNENELLTGTVQIVIAK